MTELYIFSQDENLLTILSEDTGLVSAPYRIEVNSVPTQPFSFTVEADHENAVHVKDENKVVFKDHEGDWRMMVIRELDDSDTTEGPETTATCEPVFLAELNDHIVVDRRFNEQTADVALNAAVEGTRWIGEVLVDLGIATTNFYYLTSTEAIWNILSTWGGEFKDVVVFDEETNEILACKIQLLQRRGAEHGQRFEIDHNTTEIGRTVLSYPKTALYGRGASLPTERGGNTRYIDFADVEWKVANGDLVDKPLGQKWVGDPEALAEYGYEKGTKHRYGTFSNQDYEDPEELLMATWQSLQTAKKPEVNYRLSVDLFEEKVSLGDTASAIDRKFARPIEIQARVIAMEYDLLDIGGAMVVEMGRFIDFDDTRIDDLEREVEKIGSRPSKVTEGSYPDVKPGTPINVQAHGGIGVIQLYWDYDSAIYVKQYEVYGSQVKDFVPDTQHLLWRGNTSAFAHTVNTDEVWYYRIRSVNYQGTVSDWSDQVTAATHRVISEDILFGEDIAAELRKLDLIADGAITFVQLSQNAKDALKQEAVTYTDEQIDFTRTQLLNDIADKADLSYVNGQLVDKVNKGDVYLRQEIDQEFLKYISVTEYETDQNGIVSRFQSVESTQEQHADMISRRVEESTFNTESGYLRNRITEVVEDLDGIESRVSNVQVGLKDVGRWTRTYRVRTANPENLTESDGSSLSNLYTYEVTAKVIGTGSNTTAVAIFKSKSTSGSSDSNGWDLEILYEEGSKTSNRPEFFINDDGKPSIRLYSHTSYYSVEVTHEKSIGRENSMSIAESRITQLADDITLKVDVDNIVSEINVNREGIRLKGNLIELDGTTLIRDGIIQNSHIENGTIERGKLVRAIIGEAQIEDLAVTAAKIASVNADRINAGAIRGIDIYGSKFRSSSGNDSMEIIGGNIQLTQSNGRYVEVSPDGLFGYNSGGSLRFQANTTFVTSSALSTSFQNVYLASNNEARVVNQADIPGDGQAESYRYLPVRAEGFVGNYINTNTAGTLGVHLYLRPAFDGEVRVTASGTTDIYRNLKALGYYGDFIEKHPDTAGNILYLRTSDRVRITNPGTTSSFTGLQVADIQARSIRRNSEMSGTHFYIGTDAGELRVTNNSLADGNYRDVRARNYYAESGYFESSTTARLVANGGGRVFMHSSVEARITTPGSNTDYVPIRAADFIPSSSEQWKTEVEKYSGSALDLLSQSVIYQYYKDGSDLLEYGFITERETPEEIKREQGISTYSTIGLTVKAIQEVNKKFEDEVNWLKIENQALRKRVQQLEEMVA